MKDVTIIFFRTSAKTLHRVCLNSILLFYKDGDRDKCITKWSVRINTCGHMYILILVLMHQADSVVFGIWDSPGQMSPYPGNHPNLYTFSLGESIVQWDDMMLWQL